uniref:F-box domain-containing protein n=1 Tax=Anopheles atroparvus TaxID=41427 RepID=A0A182J5F9_ANOAO
MSSISDLPPEILDHVFGYLGTADQTRARLVCHQWNEQLSTLRYTKARKLRLTFDRLNENPSDMQWLAKSIGKHHCIEVDWYTMYKKSKGPAIKNCTARLVDVLNANRFSLEELWLRNCSWTTLRAVFGALGRQRRLRNLKLTKIVGISGRRFRKIQLKEMILDEEATGWLGSLSIDVLSLNRCKIITVREEEVWSGSFWLVEYGWAR